VTTPPEMPPPPPPPPPAYGAQPGYAMPPPGYGAQPGYGQYGQQQPRNGMGIASLVLGLIALPFAFILVGVIPGVLAIVLGIVGLKRAGRGEASSRVLPVVGIVAGVLASLVAVVMIAFVASHTDEIGDLAQCLEEAGQVQEARDACNRRYEEDTRL